MVTKQSSFTPETGAAARASQALFTASLYAVDAGIASGKTETAIHYIVHENRSQNVLYVAPTIALLVEIEQRITDRLNEVGSERPLRRIDSDNQEKVREHTRTFLDHAQRDHGIITCITSDTFTNILPYLSSPHDWLVILDEAIKPYETISYRPNDPVYMGLIEDLIYMEEDGPLLPRPDQNELLWTIATQDFTQRAETKADEYRNPAIVALANLVLNRALYTHAHVYDDSRLFALSHLDPTNLLGFRETIILTAHFYETLTYAIWSSLHGVEFIDHPYFTQDKLTNIYDEQGPNVQLNHLLHEDDHASKRTLQRNFNTGQPYSGDYQTPKGERVVDYFNHLVAEHFGTEPYLLVVPGWVYRNYPRTDFPNHATVVTAHVEGLNQYWHVNNVAILATLNPYPDVISALQNQLDLDQDTIRHIQRYHTNLQIVGRIVRHPDNTDTKNVIVLSKADAEFVSSKYVGSTLRGQLDNSPSLRQLWAEHRQPIPRKPPLAKDSAYQELRKRLNTLRKRKSRADDRGEAIPLELDKEIMELNAEIDALKAARKQHALSPKGH